MYVNCTKVIYVKFSKLYIKNGISTFKFDPLGSYKPNCRQSSEQISRSKFPEQL